MLTPKFALLLCATATFGLSFSTYFLLPKYLALELGANASAIGGLNAVAMLASVIAMPFIGTLVDRYQRKLFGILGALVFATASAGYLLVDEIGPLLWTIRVFQGAAFTFFFVAASTLATDLSPPARIGQAIGLFGAVMISTNALGPAIAEWGSARFGWDLVFMFTVGAGIVAAALAARINEPRQQRHQHEASSMWDVIRRPGLGRTLLVSCLVGWTMGTLYTFYQPWALGLGFRQVSGYLIGFALSAMVVRVGLGGLADRLGRLRVATVACGLYVAAPIALIWVDVFGLVFAGTMLGLTHGLFFPALNAVALDSADAHERGKGMAAYHGAFNIGFAAGSYFCGHIALRSSYPFIFMLAALTCITAFAILVRDLFRRHSAT